MGSAQVELTQITSRRKAWSGDYSEQVGNFNIDAGFAESRESDYVSFGWSVNTLADFNEKNTTLRFGVAGTDDRVEVLFEPAYLAEPYKIVEKSIEIFPSVFLQEAFGENSPNKRNSESVYTSINRAVPKLRGAIEASYRLYTDTYGVVAHTLAVSWLQHVGSKLLLEPSIRHLLAIKE